MSGETKLLKKISQIDQGKDMSYTLAFLCELVQSLLLKATTSFFLP